jgi:GNAT superfamily N-acetyltransferase
MECIRRIGHHDIAGVVRLSSEAGWNQLPEDWHRLFDLMPGRCYGIEAGECIAASTTAFVYPDLAWIGMVLTSAQYRGRGFARRLLELALDELPVDRSRLDATDMGRPLYLKLGYVDEYPVERWVRMPSLQSPSEPLPPFREELIALDRPAFGYDRACLLRRLAAEGRTYATSAAYAMTRAGRNARFFGPCVALDDASARHVIDAFLSDYTAEPVFWDLCPEKADLARSYGFEPVRRLMRMRRGPADNYTQPSPNIYAMAGFEFG